MSPPGLPGVASHPREPAQRSPEDPTYTNFGGHAAVGNTCRQRTP